MVYDNLNKLAVDILVTWRCNLRCKKCCVPKTGKEADLSQFKETLDKLYNAGIRRILLTGGDPLIREDIADIARHAKERGFDIYLSTNGLLLEEKWHGLAPYISWINLSLDCPTAETNETFIGAGGALQFKNVLSFLDYYERSDEKNAKVKLATVITQKNKEQIVQLGQLIYEEQKGYRPDIWRLYQFSDQFSDDPNAFHSGYGFGGELDVSAYEAEEIISILKKRFPDVDVSYRTAESRDESFIFLTPDLVFTYPQGKDYISFGDTKTMSSDEIRNALYEQNRIWGKIIKNREIYC